MSPYHYSVVQCRDARALGERRNVALLVVSADERKAWLRRGLLSECAHLADDEARFVSTLLDTLEDEAGEVAREGDPARVHDWLRTRARPSEDSVWMSTPAVGVAPNLEVEVGRLAHAHLISVDASSGREAAERIRRRALEAMGVGARFSPRTFECGPTAWSYSDVMRLETGRFLVFDAFDLPSGTSEQLIEAAWLHNGRAKEVLHFYPGTRWITVVPPASIITPAVERALHLMEPLNVVRSEAQAMELLKQLGVMKATTRSTAVRVRPA